MNPDKIFGRFFVPAFVAVAILSVGWLGFLVWAVYTLVEWLITK